MNCFINYCFLSLIFILNLISCTEYIEEEKKNIGLNCNQKKNVTNYTSFISFDFAKFDFFSSNITYKKLYGIITNNSRPSIN